MLDPTTEALAGDPEGAPRVAVVMGSASDWPTMRRAAETLGEFGVAHEALVVSAHRMPDEMFAFAESAPRSRPAGDHRRRRRRRPPARDAGGQDDRAGARRARAVEAPRRAGLAVLDRADAGRRARSPRSPSARPARPTPPCSPSPCSAPTTRPSPPRWTRYRARAAGGGGAGAPRARRRALSVDRPAGGDRHARRRPARPLRAAGGPHDGLPHAGARPRPVAPAGAVADLHLVAPYDDRGALDALAAECAVVTTEFENPPAAALARLAARTLVAPPPAAVAIAQDRVAEKSFLGASGAPDRPVGNARPTATTSMPRRGSATASW